MLTEMIDMVAEMTTPQLAAAAPVKLCPLCGRRMQHCGTNVTTHNYACFQHDQVFYLNYHYAFLDENGRIKEAPAREPGKVPANYDPRRSR